MIKIFINEQEIITLKATMDVRIGKRINFLGSEYFIDRVSTTKEFINVYCIDKHTWAEKKKNENVIASDFKLHPVARPATPPFGLGTRPALW